MLTMEYYDCFFSRSRSDGSHSLSESLIVSTDLTDVTLVSDDTYQSVTVPKMSNDTDNFFRYQIFLIPIRVLFLVPNFSDTDSETFFRYQILPIPVLLVSFCRSVPPEFLR